MARIGRGGLAPDAMRTLVAVFALAGSTTNHVGVAGRPAVTGWIRDCVAAPLTARAASAARTTPEASRAKATTP